MSKLNDRDASIEEGNQRAIGYVVAILTAIIEQNNIIIRQVLEIEELRRQGGKRTA